MFYNSKDNTYIQLDTCFTLGDVQYPANWLRLASIEERLAIGLQEVITIGEYKDDALYFNVEKFVGAERKIINTERPNLSDKEQAIQTIDKLESQVTSRMLREAALGIEKSKQLLLDIQTQIEIARTKLN